MNEFEGQYPPGILENGDVEESKYVAEQSNAEDFDMTQLPDED